MIGSSGYFKFISITFKLDEVWFMKLLFLGRELGKGLSNLKENKKVKYHIREGSSTNYK